MKTRWRDGGDEASDEVLALEEHGASAVFPDGLERELEAAIGALFETVLGHGGPGDVTAEALELAAVAAVDALFGKEADAGMPQVR
ncbi:MAG: hypothetical protein SFV15_21840 [Polyangiaceae bacterium]|nr:hypothetical protein [Polyangiaceae bacterium]